MKKNAIPGLAAFVGVMTLSSVGQAQTFYSPSQSELSSFVFADYWPGNGAALTNTTLVGDDGVEYTFNTGFSSPTPDSFSRSQWNMPFTQDLTGYENIGLAFEVPAGGSVNGHDLYAQIGLHYNGGASMAGSGWVLIGTGSRTNIYLPLDVIPSNQLSQLTSFDIELRSDDTFDADVGDRVRAFTAPAPPKYVDGYQISDFEGSDLASWGPSFQPDHAHTIVMADGSDFNNGVTKGTHALQIHRTFTGENFPATSSNLNFRWGSETTLTAGGGAAPQGDYNGNNTVDAADYTVWRDNFGSTTANLPNDPTPEIVDQSDYATWKTNFGQTGEGGDPGQANIDELVDAINAARTDGRIAFDVSFLNADAFPENNPTFLGFDLFINDGAGFYQAHFGFPSLPAIGEFYQGVTLSLPISDFVRQGTPDDPADLGTTPLEKNDFITMGLSTNTDASATFVIDNIRVQNLAPPEGLASVSGVPEPSTLLIALFAAALGHMGLRRRS